MRRSSCGCGRILASASRFVTAIKKSALRPIQAVHGRSRCPRCGPAALANPDHMTEERRLPLGIPRWESNSVDQDGDDWDAEAGPGPFVSNHVDYVHVRFFGRTAVAQGSESWAQKS